MFRLSYGHKEKEKPSPEEIKAAAARCGNRADTAEELGITVTRLYYLLQKYHSLNVAFIEGQKEHKKTNASKQTQTQSIQEQPQP